MEKTSLGKNYFIDLNKDSQILIAGITGCGKLFLLASILTNLIYNNSKDVEIYLSQIVKGDIGWFSECKSVKYVAYDIDEVLISLDRVISKSNENFCGNKALIFDCQSIINGIERLYQIKYLISECKWILFKMKFSDLYFFL